MECCQRVVFTDYSRKVDLIKKLNWQDRSTVSGPAVFGLLSDLGQRTYPVIGFFDRYQFQEGVLYIVLISCYHILVRNLSELMKGVELMKGYYIQSGYMGYVEGRYLLFSSEEEYAEYMENDGE